MGRHTNRLGKAALLSMASFLVLANAPCAQAQDSAAGQEFTINLPAGPLSDRLIDLGDALGVNIFAADRLVAGKTAPAISGSLTPERAITALLDGSDLSVRQTGPAAFEIAQADAGSGIDTIPDSGSASLVDEPLISDTVVVTGSRIERTAVNSPSPIDIVTAEEIAKLGLTDTTEALRFVPALNQSGSITAPTDRAVFGQSVLNLRGLGEDRTLVLVNGRRHVSGVVNTASVDVATIPSALIDRVEVLTGGGSSIYGADAVSGVVNYVLKDDFEGVDARANVSLPTRGSGESYFAAVTAGGNFGGGRGNAVINVEYYNQSELRAEQREVSRTGVNVIPNNPLITEALGVDPRFQNVFISNATVPVSTSTTFSLTGSTLLTDEFPTISGGVPQVGGVPSVQILDPVTGQIRPVAPANFVSGFVNAQGGDDFRNVSFRDQRGALISDTQRYNVNMLVDYDFTDTITGFIDAKYARTESVGRRISVIFEVVDEPLSLDNPFIPQEIQDQAASLAAQNIPVTLNVARSLLDNQTNQPQEQNRETFRIVGGFKGEVSKALSYEVSANYGRTATQALNPTALFPDRLAAALDVVTDPETGNPVCRSDLDPNALAPIGLSLAGLVPGPGFRTFNPGDGRCAPLNLFVPPDQLDQAAADFVFAPRTDTFEIEQVVLNATVSGSSEDFFSLPAGVIQYAAGVEYREERSQNSPSELDVAALGRNQIRAVDPIGGDFDVIEGFAEVNIPILTNMQLAQTLAIDASVRLADYSTVGSATSYAFGAVWEPVENLRLRGSYNRAIRAPNIGELFAVQNVAVRGLGFGTDPCGPENLDSGTSNREANCRELVPNLDTFDPTPSELGGVTVITGGNPDLQEETANTYSIGLAYKASFVPGLSVVADYYRIEIEDAVARGVSRPILLANCVDAPTVNNPFCDAITRNPATGLIEEVQNSNLNLSEISSEGIDYQINYAFTLDGLLNADFGQFNAQLAGTYVIQREDQVFAGFPETIDQLDGELNFPKHFINFSLGWFKGPWSADYGLSYQSSQVALNRFGTIGGIEDVKADPFFVDQPFTGDAFVHFLGGGYQINDDFQVSLRVNNLFDRDPFPNAVTSARPVGFLGRTVQLGVQATF